MARAAMGARVPDGQLGKAGNGKGRREGRKSGHAGDQPARHGRHKVGAPHQLQKREKAGQRHHNAPFEPLPLKGGIDHATKPVAGERHQRVVERTEPREIEHGPRSIGMPLPQHADIMLVEERPEMKLGRRGLGRHEGEVNIPPLELVNDARLVQRADRHPHVWRHPAQPGDERNDHRVERIVGGGDGDRQVRTRRIEERKLHQTGNVGEDLPAGRVRILTQETQKGKPAEELARAKPNPMINGHQDWLEGIAAAALQRKSER